MDDLSAILFIISIVGLILSTPLLLYYGQSFAWESIFIICITFGIIACIILIYLRTPNLEHIEPIIQPIVYNDINTGINDVDKTVETVEDFDAIFQEV